MKKEDVQNYFTDAQPYRDILSLLSDGEEHAKSCGYLCSLLKMEDREMRKCIENMRRNGVCILSTSRGYFLPKTRDDVLRWKRHNIGVANKFLSINVCADRWLERC